MKITSVSYKKIFPIAQFVNETIGIEATVDEGEDPSDVLEKLKEKITMWHLASEIAEDTKKKWSYDEVKYGGNLYQEIITKPIDRPHKEEIPVIQVGVDPILRGIYEANSLEDLGKYKNAAANSGYFNDYMNRVKELTMELQKNT